MSRVQFPKTIVERREVSSMIETARKLLNTLINYKYNHVSFLDFRWPLKRDRLRYDFERPPGTKAGARTRLHMR